MRAACRSAQLSRKEIKKMLPYDTITYANVFQGNSTTTIATPPCTILGYQVMQENIASNIYFWNGTDLIFQNFALNTPYISVNIPCKGDFKIEKEGNDRAFVTVNYITRTETATSSGQIVTENGFTYGELTISFFLFIIMVGLVTGFILKAVCNKKWR